MSTRCATGTVAPARRAGARGLRRRRSKTRGPTASSAPRPASRSRLTLWVGFTERELGVIKDAVADFERQHPGINVKVVGGINDDKIVAAIRGGNAPDVAQSFSADNTGAFCASGAWIDLKPYMRARRRQRRHLPGRARRLHAVRRQALRAADARRRLRPLLQQGRCSRRPGITARRRRSPSSPPTRRSSPQRNPDGTLKVVGFDPVSGFYENAPAHFGPLFGAKWVDADGKSSSRHDPAWAKLLKWQKEPDRLVRLRQARQVPGRRRRRVLRVERVRDAARSR